MKWFAVAALALATLTGAAGLVDSRAAPPPAAPPAANQDRSGDSLPKGAVARLGTTHFRPGGAVAATAVLPGGERFVTAVGPRVTVWDARTGEAVWAAAAKYAGTGLRFGGQEDQRCAAASPDGKLIATGGQDKAVRLWDAATGKLVRVLKDRPAVKRGVVVFVGQSSTRAVAFTANGSEVIFVADTEVSVWEAATGREIRRFKVAAGAARLGGVVVPGGGVALSADGSLLAVTAGGRLMAWDVPSGQRLFDREVPAGVRSVAVSPDGRRLALGPRPAGGKAFAFTVYDGRTGKELRRVETGAVAVTPLAFTADGRRVAGETRPGDPWQGVWDAQTGALVGKHTTGPGRGFGVYGFLDKDRLITANRAGVLAVRDAESGKRLTRPGGHVHAVKAVRFAPGGRLVTASGPYAFQFGAARARVWDWRRGVTVARAEEAGYAARGRTVGLSPGGRLLLARASATELALRRADTGEVVRRLPVPAGKVSTASCGFSRDGRLLAVGTDEAVHVIDLTRNTGWRQLPVAGGVVNGVAVSPDGSLVAAAVGAPGGQLRVWDAKTGAGLKIELAPGRRAALGAVVAFSPDGRSVAVAGGTGTGIEIYEIASRRLRRRLTSTKTPQVLTFAPDGRHLAVSGSGGMIGVRSPGGIIGLVAVGGPAMGLQVFDLAAGKAVKKFDGHRGGVTALAFSPDGRHLASGGADTTVYVWDTSPLAAKADPLTPKRLGELWDALTGGPEAAFDAVVELAGDPQRAGPFLKQQLGVKVAVDAAAVAEQVRRLSADAAAERQDATRRLRAMGPAAGPTLREALKSSKSAEATRRLRQLLAGVESDGLRRERAAEALGMMRAGR